MNEEIAKIAKDCGLYIAYDNKAVTDKEIEFFAKLIALECAKIADEPSGWQPGYRIKRHFGVE